MCRLKNFAQSRMSCVENRVILYHKWMKNDSKTDLIQLLGAYKGKRYFLLSPYCDWFPRCELPLQWDTQPVETVRRQFFNQRDFVLREVLQRTCADVFGGPRPKMLNDMCRKTVCSDSFIPSTARVVVVRLELSNRKEHTGTHSISVWIECLRSEMAAQLARRIRRCV